LTKGPKSTTGFKRCSICKHIPDHKFVETLHTEERLPKQVDQLEILGGYGFYGSPQVRKCPLCKTYYTYLHDHDSESGVGIGWTDEEIQRLTPESALDVMARVLEDCRHSLQHFTKKHDQPSITKHTQQVNRLIQEIASLKKLLSVGE